MISLDTVQHKTFAPLVGHCFVTGEVRLELTGVMKLGHKRADAPRDPFSLTFRGAKEIEVTAKSMPSAQRPATARSRKRCELHRR